MGQWVSNVVALGPPRFAWQGRRHGLLPRLVYMIRWLFCGLLVAAIAGCSNPSDDSASTSSLASEELSTDTEEPGEDSAATSTATSTSAEASTGADSDADDAATESTVGAIRAYDDGPTTTNAPDPTSAWISRSEMSASAIEVSWSAPEGAAAYDVHRVPRLSDDEPAAEVMTVDNLIHTGEAQGRFADDGVEEGTRYWYGVRGLSDDGVLLSHGWHRADAVTDLEPPDPVGVLSAVVEGAEVLVTWTQPDENYELHGYQIFRSLDGGEPEPMATTWKVEQTSFVDDRPPAAGQVTYEIVAFDFHWNDSEPARVAVDLP